MITFRLKKSVGKSEMVSFEAASAAAAFVDLASVSKAICSACLAAASALIFFLLFRSLVCCSFAAASALIFLLGVTVIVILNQPISCM
jgi:hypothetical protein